VEDGVDVVEDVLRAEGGGEVAMAVGDEIHAQAGGEGGPKFKRIQLLTKCYVMAKSGFS